MKIGEFAKACNVPVSVLRYYDSYGLLKPIYHDSFTGYRYYSESQIAVCERINELKAAEFSLAQIKKIITGNLSEEEITLVFDEKKEQLRQVLDKLDVLREKISGGTFMETINLELMHEDVHLPFENDDKVIGKWEILGEYNSRKEYELDKKLPEIRIGSKKREIYFLPQGEWYWCYSWTKGKLLVDGGDCSYVNEYTIEKQADELFMFVNLKAYDYLQTGRTTLLVLRRLDNRHYRAAEISRKDNIDMPFIKDDGIVGKWEAVSFVQHKEEFAPEAIRENFVPYFKEIEFLPEGECVSVYGEEIISGRAKQEWTKGYLLRKWNSTACAYEIKNIDDMEYLFIEWKSGDYRWGGYETDYYVFQRQES